MDKRKKLIVFSMAVGIFLCMLDTTVMNIALPKIQTGLHVSLEDLSWALNIYTIVFAVFTIPFGRIADIIGRNRVYIVGLILFACGSFVSGAATTAPFLIVGRGIQSLGAAIVFPASMTIGIATNNFQDRTKVLATLGVTQGIAAALGPTIGGVVTQYLGWRYIFFINIPLVIFVIISCCMLLPLKTERVPKAKIDMLGMLLSMVMLLSLTLALVKGNDWGWSSRSVIELIGTVLISFVLFILVERRTAAPMIPMGLFKDRQFVGASLAVILTGVFLVAIMVIMPTFFTRVLNKSELVAAFMITPTSAMIFVFSPIGGLLIDKIGPRMMVSLGFFSMISGYLTLLVINPSHYTELAISLLLIGAGYGIIAGPVVVLGASKFTGELLSASQSVLGLFRQIGTLLAVAIFVSALTANLKTAQNQSIIQANTRIEAASIPQSEKVTFKLQANNAIHHDGATTKSSGGPSGATVSTIIHRQYEERLTAIPNYQFLGQSQKRKLYHSVASKVSTKIKNQMVAIQLIQRQIAVQTKKNMKLAFMKPYRQAIPFIIIAGFSSLLFYRKKDYLD